MSVSIKDWLKYPCLNLIVVAWSPRDQLPWSSPVCLDAAGCDYMSLKELLKAIFKIRGVLKWN